MRAPMTQAPHRAPLAFSDLDSIVAAIRAGGGRLSSTRRVVLSALFAAEGPVSADYIAEGLGGRMVRSEVSSVYRALERLEELGVVRHVHVGHGPGLYALEGDTPREYLVCERCDRVDTVAADRLDRVRGEIRAEIGYEARFSHFPIMGLCAACAGGEDARRAQHPPEPPAETPPEHGPGGDPHSHPHVHGGHTHDHPHTRHDHQHTDHEHQHTHGDYAHSHDHVHEQGLEHHHEHAH